MGRGGRSGGGGRRSSYSAPRARAPPPAARKPAGAPSPAAGSSSSVGRYVGSAVANVASAITEGWLWGAGSAMAHRAMDSIMGPRKFEIEHTTKQQAPAAAAAAAGEPSSPCQVHAQAFQDCINHNGSDISRCQFYVDILNDCRRRGQVAVVETSG